MPSIITVLKIIQYLLVEHLLRDISPSDIHHKLHYYENNTKYTESRKTSLLNFPYDPSEVGH